MSTLSIKKVLKTITGINEPPVEVAFSFAVGTFVGFSPFFGFQIIIAIALAWLFKVTKFPAISATFISNTFTSIPLYTFNLWVGLKLTHSNIAFSDVHFNDLTWSTFMQELRAMVVPLFVGCTVVGILAAIAGFFLVLYAFKIKDRLSFLK
ncbi:MAG: DUF2062 domain-containing protein [Candidatus Magnetoovum sp. WYHC-5]|nr:DUF2062 domain-containing protein [Candidatus Magnetoovum sp. WYHC-5]